MASKQLLKVAAMFVTVAVGAAAPAWAQSATANLPVSANVTNNCTISTGALAFGTYDPVVANATTDLDATGSVTIACTRNSTATIGLGLGANASGSTRRMNDGAGNFLTYEMYQNAGRTTLWGDAGAGLLSPAAAPSRAPRTFTVYGRVAQNQDAAAGAFSDTVVATVNF